MVSRRTTLARAAYQAAQRQADQARTPAQVRKANRAIVTAAAQLPGRDFLWRPLRRR
jgi:hypothetical protein